MRVKLAYTNTFSRVQEYLSSCNIREDQLELYIRVFKDERQLELWGKDKGDKKFILLKTYEVCAASGDIGPKRKQGDYQVPEGFYSIDRFNPQSTYHLSLGLNYPNQSDKILSSKTSPGGNIFIHGSCVSAGCLAITDEWIEELYVYCVEAQNNGGTIQVTIFPFKPSVENMMYNTLGYPELKHEFSLWTDLKRGYDQFNESYELPNVQFNEDGSHTII